MNQNLPPGVDMIQPIAGDEGELHVGPYRLPKPEPECGECKDDGPKDGTPCKKCGYQRF